MFVSEAGERRTGTRDPSSRQEPGTCAPKCILYWPESIYAMSDVAYLKRSIYHICESQSLNTRKAMRFQKRLEATHATISGRRGTARAVVLLVVVLVLLLG